MASFIEKVASTFAAGVIGGSLSIAIMKLFSILPYGDLRWLWVGGGGLALGTSIQYIVHIVSAKADLKPSDQTVTTDNGENGQTEPPEKQEPQVCFSTPQQLIDENERVSALSATARKAVADAHIGKIMRLSLTVKTVSLNQYMDGRERIFVFATDHPLACHFQYTRSVEQLKAVAANDILEIEGTIRQIDSTHVSLTSCKLLAPPERPANND